MSRTRFVPFVLLTLATGCTTHAALVRDVQASPAGGPALVERCVLTLKTWGPLGVVIPPSITMENCETAPAPVASSASTPGTSAAPPAAAPK